MQNNYNTVAAFYDPLNHLVFGKSTLRAQQWLVQHVPPRSRVLVIGGGTGAILTMLSEVHSSGLEIDYVEHAQQMMEKARKKNAAGNAVRYYTVPIQHFEPAGTYDVIITPFLLDNFDMGPLKNIFDRLNGYLKAGGLWLAADFLIREDSPAWQRLLLWLMYRFFRLVCNVGARGLPHWQDCFSQYAYNKKGEASFYSNFITAAVYSSRSA